MAEITAALVKELREKTGAGMMDCKRALAENNGDIEAAADWLREKGILKAAKKADRVAAEGLIGVASNGKAAALAEVNSETDFVARNENFQKAVRTVAEIALANNGDVTKVAHAATAGGGTVNEMLQGLVATIGENMSLRRTAALSVNEGVVATYIHNVAADGLGKIGVLVALESPGDVSRLTDLGRKVAMHVASMKPLAATTDELDPAVVEKERQILTAQAADSGKPANVIEKMVEGRIRKFYQESVLVEQAFVMDPDVTVGKFIENAGKNMGAPVKLKGFLKFEVGEGIEKAASDFAAEVAAFAQPKQ
ncbi:MAG: translation elongation factor Ts [Rhodobacterales bacterium 12-64-8]|nr:MAG: translation elongation factor Ts [Rhodobacterales bacterium 12-64-8]OYX50343.1 MAG: translation elongation factor Ts [Alphaproteobacteria bacterium 32-64-14]